MGLKEKIRDTLNEAELYKTQGLLNEARAKYDQVAKLIQDNDNLKKNGPR